MTTTAEALEAASFAAAASCLEQMDMADVDLSEFTGGDQEIENQLLDFIYQRVAVELRSLTAEFNQNLANRDIMCDAYLEKLQEQEK
jgi:hypothetical protein